MAGALAVIVPIAQLRRAPTPTCGGVFGGLPPLPLGSIWVILASLLLRASGGRLLGPPGRLYR